MSGPTGRGLWLPSHCAPATTKQELSSVRWLAGPLPVTFKLGRIEYSHLPSPAATANQ